MSNHIPSKVWDGITYPFPNFNGCTVQVWEWIDNLSQRFMMDLITYPCWDGNYSLLVKGAPSQCYACYRACVLVGQVDSKIYLWWPHHCKCAFERPSSLAGHIQVQAFYFLLYRQIALAHKFAINHTVTRKISIAQYARDVRDIIASLELCNVFWCHWCIMVQGPVPPMPFQSQFEFNEKTSLWYCYKFSIYHDNACVVSYAKFASIGLS